MVVNAGVVVNAGEAAAGCGPTCFYQAGVRRGDKAMLELAGSRPQHASP